MAAALFGSEQVPPLSARVIVTVWAAPVAVAEQLAKPLVSRTVGVAGTENTDVAFGNDDGDRVAACAARRSRSR